MFANILHHLTLILLERGQFGGISNSTLKPHLLQHDFTSENLSEMKKTWKTGSECSKKNSDFKKMLLLIREQ